jgi:hypothetical protein
MTLLYHAILVQLLIWSLPTTKDIRFWCSQRRYRSQCEIESHMAAAAAYTALAEVILEWGGR